MSQISLIGEIAYHLFQPPNVALVHGSFHENTTGYYNVASGYQSLYSNTTGSNRMGSLSAELQMSSVTPSQ